MDALIHRSIRFVSEKRRSKGVTVVLSALAALSIGGLGVTQQAVAAPTYSIQKVLVAGDQWKGEPDLVSKKLYKPHEVAVDAAREIWISSNERTAKAGITVFRDHANKVLATINIDEPGVEFHGEDEEDETIGNEEEEGEDPNFPSELRMRPSVCLPVQLPAGTPRPKMDGFQPRWFDKDQRIMCAPLGAESHPRHPHGIDIDKQRNLVHQVIEHSGLKWNHDRSRIHVADNTDEESGLLLIYDIKNVRNPRIVTGYLLGHGAHELAVNELDGRVWQGNHEDSPGVTPNIWVDVIDPTLGEDGYAFVDTGWWNAVQGIEVDESLNQVFGTTHVGEKMFAFDGGCIPAPNAAPDDEAQMGENCILYTVDLLTPFLEQVPEGEEVLFLADTEIREAIEAGEEPPVLPSVLHMHDLTVGVNGSHRAYQTLHSIHHAEHTGSPEEAALPETEEEEEEEEEPEHHFMGRWLAEVNVNPADSRFKTVTYIDLSNGMNILDVPNVEDIPEGTPFEDQFVHAHWVSTDPDRRAVHVTGEHTGNLGIVNRGDRELKQVIAISRTILNCEPELDEEGNPEFEEPHVHGVQVNPLTGTLYVSDEGEHCFYESVTKLTPNE